MSKEKIAMGINMTNYDSRLSLQNLHISCFLPPKSEDAFAFGLFRFRHDIRCIDAIDVIHKILWLCGFVLRHLLVGLLKSLHRPGQSCEIGRASCRERVSVVV